MRWNATATQGIDSDPAARSVDQTQILCAGNVVLAQRIGHEPVRPCVRIGFGESLSAVGQNPMACASDANANGAGVASLATSAAVQSIVNRTPITKAPKGTPFTSCAEYRRPVDAASELPRAGNHIGHGFDDDIWAIMRHVV